MIPDLTNQLSIEREVHTNITAVWFRGFQVDLKDCTPGQAEKQIAAAMRKAATKLDPQGGCDRPPEGWLCTRGRDHEGPCAAVPQRLTSDEQDQAGGKFVLELSVAPLLVVVGLIAVGTILWRWLF